MKVFAGYLNLMFLSAAMLAMVGVARADEANCGPLKPPGQYGPWDFRVDKDKLPVVLYAHFPPEVEHLQQMKTGYFGRDIDFTLRAIPNHPRALMAMMRLAEKEKTERPKGSNWNVECYFDRALRWRSDDGDVRMLYGMFLAKRGRDVEALEQLKLAESGGDLTANGHYNMGLIYFRMKKYEQAMEHARIAYAQGYTLPGLRKMLQGAGKWQSDPVPPKAASEKATAMPPPDTPLSETPTVPSSPSVPVVPGAK